MKCQYCKEPLDDYEFETCEVCEEENEEIVNEEAVARDDYEKSQYI